MRTHTPRFIFWIGILAVSQFSASMAEELGRITTERRSFETREGELIEYEVGTLFVPENRRDPTSRTIGVGFARFPATAQPPSAPPMFILPGGPGSSLLSRLKEGRLPGSSILLRYRSFCDVVFVDQRGFSERGDMFLATYRPPSRRADQPLTLDEEIEAFKTFANETVADFDEREIDLRGYTVKQCAHDVADLRKALSYDKIILNGTSFGSQ